MFFIFFTLLVRNASAKGAGSFEIDEEAAVRALEHSLVQSGSLLLKKGKFDFQVGLGFSHTTHDVLLFSSSNSLVGQTKNTFTTINMPLRLRAGLPYNAQIDFAIPLRYASQQFIQTNGRNPPVDKSQHGSGFGDINITLSKTLSREKGNKPDIIGFLSWDAGNGKKSDNSVPLSEGFDEFRLGLTLTKSQDPLVFSGSFSVQGSVEKDHVKPGRQYQLSLATFLAASPSTSLKFSFDQIFLAKTKINNKDVIGSDRTIALLNIGISSVVRRNTFLSLSAGAGLTNNSPDYTVNLSLSTRFDLP
jgi:hypothetical protein